jgi:hypothetical protein
MTWLLGMLVLLIEHFLLLVSHWESFRIGARAFNPNTKVLFRQSLHPAAAFRNKNDSCRARSHRIFCKERGAAPFLDSNRGGAHPSHRNNIVGQRTQHTGALRCATVVAGNRGGSTAFLQNIGGAEEQSVPD